MNLPSEAPGPGRVENLHSPELLDVLHLRNKRRRRESRAGLGLSGGAHGPSTTRHSVVARQRNSIAQVTSMDKDESPWMCYTRMLYQPQFPAKDAYKCLISLGFLEMERVMGIEPTWPAWKAGALPLSYTRNSSNSNV